MTNSPRYLEKEREEGRCFRFSYKKNLIVIQKIKIGPHTHFLQKQY